MSTLGTMNVASNYPSFDGTDYPYWKNKMRIPLEAIDKDLWDIVDKGIPEATIVTSPEVVKKNWQLDAKARSIIAAHLNKAQFNRISGLDSSKKMWMRLSKVNEGVSAERDSRVDTLRSLFNRFKRLDNEHVQQTFGKLTNISNELQALGAADITDHEVVKKLLRSLDESFEFLSLMIQEKPDFKTLDPADILERLNAHELKLSEKRDLYSSKPKVHALKARARRVSSDEESEADTDDPETLSRELALLTRKFQRFTKKNRFGSSSRSSSRKSKDDESVEARKRVCHKCKKPGHYIAECPLWEKEARLKKKKKGKDDSSDEKTKKKSSRSSKSAGYRNSSSRKARAYLGKELDTEESGSNPDAEEEESEESVGVAGLALATTLVSKSIFSTEESGLSHVDDEAEDTTPSFCFMAKSSKVSSYSSSDDPSDEEPDENYAKLASKQQRALEKIQISLNKSDDMLVEEMTKTQKLTDESKILQSKFDDLFNRHEALLTDHEKLAHEFLMRKQELERIRMSHDDLRKENDSLLSQQIIMPQEGFNPPCLKCIEHDRIISVPSSSMSSDSVISIASVVSNPSSEVTI